MASTSFQDLPPAVLRHILLCCSDSSEDAAAARLACKALAEASCTAVLAATPKLSVSSRCKMFPGLRSLDLKYIKLTDSELLSLTCLKSLQKLSLHAAGNSCSTDAFLRLFTGLAPSLQQLDVSAVSDELAALLAGLWQLKSLALSGRLSDGGMQHLTSLQQLQCLSLSCCDMITGEGLQVLTALSNLESLQLHSCLQLDDAALLVIGRLTRLSLLCLSHSCEDASALGLAALSSLRHLRQLNLSAACGEDVAPATLAQLLGRSQLPHLTALDLSYCESVSGDVLRAVSTSLTQLRVLGVSGMTSKALHGVRHLKHLSNLESLQLRWVGQLKDSHLAAFMPHLASLTALDLSYCRSLTSEGLQVLQWMTQLRSLNLLAVASDDLGWLGALQQLRGLTASMFAGSSIAWQQVAQLTKLQTLALRRCQFVLHSSPQASSSSQPAPDAACLARLQQLLALDCSGSSVSAPGLSVLQQLPCLQQLGLSRCQGVSNAALAAIAGCSSLRRLDLRLRGTACTWSLRGMMALLVKLPGMQAVYVSELPAGLPPQEACRILACNSEQVPLPVARDAGYGTPMLSAVLS